MELTNEEQFKILEVIRNCHDQTDKYNKLIRVETRDGEDYLFFGKDYCFHLEPEEKEIFLKFLDKYKGRYFLEDKPGHSMFRGWFSTVEKARRKAEECQLSWWRITAYNHDTNSWEILDQSLEKEGK